MKTYLVTGSTQGLGLQIATRLARDPNIRVILAVRDPEKGLRIAGRLGANVSVAHLDLSTVASVERFVASWTTKLDGLVNNAGVQLADTERFTPDGFEETIAVNHLAAFQLTLGLEPHLCGARVLFLGSATHHPDHGKRFGFRGAQIAPMCDLLAGKSSSTDIAQRNRDRYATSKFLNMVTAREFTRRVKPFESYVLDPGLMAGTGLARNQKVLVRLVWKYILPLTGFLNPRASSPKQSASVATWILTTRTLPFPAGTIVSHHRTPSDLVWTEKVDDPKIGAEVHNQSQEILTRHRSTP